MPDVVQVKSKYSKKIIHIESFYALLSPILDFLRGQRTEITKVSRLAKIRRAILAKTADVYWIHLIRMTSVMCVVILHSAAQVLQLDVTFESQNWWVANVIDSAMRMCVPLLFMITGFLLLGKSESLNLFFRKRFSKIVIPLVVWTAVYICWLIFVESKNPSPISPLAQETLHSLNEPLPFSLIRFLFTPAYYHLWFMYALIGLYLCMPCLRVLVQNSPRKLLWYFVIIWIIASYFFPLFAQANFVIYVDLNMVTGNIGYLVLGHLLGTIVVTRRLFLWMLPLFIASVVVTAVGTWWLSSPQKLDQFFYGSSPAIPVMAMSCFIILRYLGENWKVIQSPTIRSIIIQLSACTFGIYLVHVLFLYIFHKGMWGFTLDAVQGNSLIFIPLTAITVYLSSFLVIFLVRRIPVIKAVAP